MKEKEKYIYINLKMKEKEENINYFYSLHLKSHDILNISYKLKSVINVV